MKKNNHLYQTFWAALLQLSHKLILVSPSLIPNYLGGRFFHCSNPWIIGRHLINQRSILRGRLTLTKSTLSALPSHILDCIKAPKWFYKEIDNRRRDYFWTGQGVALGD
jgi:hypothetical protein